ncbi:hypothetical protein [Kribbella solani]|uniref:DUF2690 domain-containing protein n=1 Tax=Kribbella solani TaxID=236067 RepID=A0A841DQS1_9ACTN|nr:hypothetical protein [Kribbella solani]MBB5980261.1 hypothetical protein [Kribbella solani]MDX2973505.1 hypothetical protein [Kribbella solani]MDX3004562.1 hypothetical protein [Kribbella solani]
MKTLGILLSTAGLAGVGAFALTAAPAQAVAAANCSGATSIASAPMLRDNKPPSWGTIRLVRDNCSQYWAEITMASPLVANAKANAFLVQYGGGSNGRVLSCDSSGGNGSVIQNQRTCRTPKVKAASGSITFVAIGREYHNYGGGYEEISENATRRTR